MNVADRIYARERLVAEDFVRLMPDVLLLRGLKPKTSTVRETGIIAAVDMSALHTQENAENKAHPVRACVAFEVVMLPVEMTGGNPLDLSPGDTVLCMNALVDPLFGNELAVTNLYRGVLAVLERKAANDDEEKKAA